MSGALDRVLAAIDAGLVDHPTQHADPPLAGSIYEAFDHISCGVCRIPMELRTHPVRGDECWFAVCEHAPQLNGQKPPMEWFVLCDFDNQPLPNERWQ